jgi:hypothetical protein
MPGKQSAFNFESSLVSCIILYLIFCALLIKGKLLFVLKENENITLNICVQLTV